MVLNRSRQSRGYNWLYKAKAAYHARQYSRFVLYGVAGTLVAPEVMLQKRLYQKVVNQLKVQYFEWQVKRHVRPYSDFSNTKAHTSQNTIVDDKGGVPSGDRSEMSKQNEIDYIKMVAKVENVDEEAFRKYLRRKPFGDNEVGEYLIDIGQLLKFLPPCPARILDLGIGSGWTSEIISKCGYEVVGLDISSDMIELAKQKLTPDLNLQFGVLDYEQPIPFGHFDAVVMYDSLHHAVNERAVIRQIAAVLKPGGRFLCLEPGKGHATSPLSIDVMKKYGTTEKDMPFSYIQTMLQEVGFSTIHQYVRIRQLPFTDIAPKEGVYQQIQQFIGLMYETAENGLTSLVVAFR